MSRVNHPLPPVLTVAPCAPAGSVYRPEPVEEIPRVEPLPVSHAFWKRALDLVLGAALLLVGFPLFVLIALVVRLTSRGPVLYRGTRVGLGGRTFHMYKFRSMFVRSDERVKELWSRNDHQGPVFKIRNDPRVTPVGASCAGTASTSCRSS